MTRFQIRFCKSKTKGLGNLQVGDQLEMVSGLICTVVEVLIYQKRKMYKTDCMGLVYADEIEGR